MDTEDLGATGYSDYARRYCTWKPRGDDSLAETESYPEMNGVVNKFRTRHFRSSVRKLFVFLGYQKYA